MGLFGRRLVEQSMMTRVLILGSIMMLAFSDAQKPTEIKESELKNLIKPTPGAVLEKSFRCGVFYIDPNEPAPEEGGRPAAALLIFNATWDAAESVPVETTQDTKAFATL